MAWLGTAAWCCRILAQDGIASTEEKLNDPSIQPKSLKCEELVALSGYGYKTLRWYITFLAVGKY